MSYSIAHINDDIDLNYKSNSFYNYYIINASEKSIDVHVPRIISDGMHYILDRIDNSPNTVTLIAYDGETIRNFPSVNLPNMTKVEMVSYGTQWIAPFVKYD